uniref:Polyisoprenoid diphosphate/phosphate phosphohydrolase PLPP6 n=1 Tax=Dromaius novaehollandiae TaxID=8790 RepID=A0A8C4J0K2_DRONO
TRRGRCRCCRTPCGCRPGSSPPPRCAAGRGSRACGSAAPRASSPRWRWPPARWWPTRPTPRCAPAAPAPCRPRSEDCMRLNPSFAGIALRSLLAVDLWASKRLGVCAAEGSAWGGARPLMKVVEVSGHGLPWLLGTAYGLCQSDSAATREVLLNLLFALLLDLVLVAVVKGLVKRRRPTHNKMDMFVTISVDKYSFPSGHATRAALVCRFVLHHLVLAVPLRVLVVLWALIVGISRVMLGRHNVTDVLFGLFLGYALYSVVEYCWLSPLSAPALFALWSS